MQAAQAEHVLGQQVVLDETGVLGLVLRDDGEVVVVEQRAALRRFPFAQGERASLPDDVPGRLGYEALIARNFGDRRSFTSMPC